MKQESQVHKDLLLWKLFFKKENYGFMNLRRFALISDQPLLIATNTKTDGDKVPPQTFS